MNPIIMAAILAYKHCLFLVGFFGFCADSLVEGQKNNTLIFTKENTFRNCSCPDDIGDNDCNYNLANLICNCKTVLPYTIDNTFYHHLTIWFTETLMLGMLLNFTAVYDLKLSLCGTVPLSGEYLTIWGLQRLQIKSGLSGQLQEQSLTIYSNRDHDAHDKFKTPCEGRHMITHVAVLDTSLFNSYSPLKSYSVENISNITGHFPHLPHSETFFSTNNKTCTITFIY
ncbi:exosomal polycystin-1-interacting protein [Tiliqua scincoides]|uniref:exosomal polycystin-1-interacting protein n=1 Tax=Tiliqua scincoides TaxID=71010 RepID=UPI00346348A4